MNYTKNHHLPQWVKSDRIRMEDFNDAMSRIESGMTANAEKADAAAAAVSHFVGSYTADGTRTRIDLPFTPSFLIISGMTESQDADSVDGLRYVALTRDNANVRRRVEFILNGFVVYPPGNYGYQTPNLNDPGRHYDFIAFK